MAVGGSGRFGWADGDVEPYEFTDIDRTAALGASFGGKLWGRPDDTIGMAGVVNGISATHVAYLNAGGLGILVGDGQLPHPGLEQILEAYYSLPVGSCKVTPDYQFIRATTAIAVQSRFFHFDCGRSFEESEQMANRA